MVPEVEKLAFAVPVIILSMRSNPVLRALLMPETAFAAAHRWVGDVARLAADDRRDPRPDESVAEHRRPGWNEPDLGLRETRSKLRRSILLGLPLGIVSWLVILWVLGVI